MIPKYIVDLLVEGKDGSVEQVAFELTRLANARYTGRDRQKWRDWLDQKRREGYTGMPLENPSICFTSRYLLTTGDAIEVQGGRTSGEVEFVVFRQGEKLFVTVGSDHCDRSSMADRFEDKPKQMCPRVISNRAWRYEDVKGHWDALILRSWVVKDGKRTLYQDSPVCTQCSVEELFEAEPLIRTDGVVLMGGTVDELMDPVFEDEFQMELLDPVLQRSIRHRYTIGVLPSDERWRGY
jgi:hypothetical protein